MLTHLHELLCTLFEKELIKEVCAPLVGRKHPQSGGVVVFSDFYTAYFFLGMREYLPIDIFFLLKQRRLRVLAMDCLPFLDGCKKSSTVSVLPVRLQLMAGRFRSWVESRSKLGSKCFLRVRRLGKELETDR